VTPAACSPASFARVRVIAATTCPFSQHERQQSNADDAVAPARKILMVTFLARLTPWRFEPAGVYASAQGAAATDRA
jgi:hypothetical protein